MSVKLVRNNDILKMCDLNSPANLSQRETETKVSTLILHHLGDWKSVSFFDLRKNCLG